MNYSLDIRQDNSLLSKAYEIRLEYNQLSLLSSKLSLFPDKQYNIQIPSNFTPDYSYLSSFNANIVLGLSSPHSSPSSLPFPFYWRYPITTYPELDYISSFNPSSIILEDQLFFNIYNLSHFKVRKTLNPITLIKSSSKGLRQTIVLPTQPQFYEGYIHIAQFSGTLEQEASLFNIYTKKESYSGDLSLIFPCLPPQTYLDFIPDSVLISRLSCSQNCRYCRLCERAIIESSILKKGLKK